MGFALLYQNEITLNNIENPPGDAHMLFKAISRVNHSQPTIFGEVKACVSEGSILGQLLFNMYTSDIVNIDQDITVYNICQ